MAKLNTADRKALSKSQFAIPSKAPGSGSYPIPDKPHAIDALARSSGKPEEATVRAAVEKKFPGLPRHNDLKSSWSAPKKVVPKTPVKGAVPAGKKPMVKK